MGLSRYLLFICCFCFSSWRQTLGGRRLSNVTQLKTLAESHGSNGLKHTNSTRGFVNSIEENNSYIPQIIHNPLDVIFMVDRSSTLDVDLVESKCLLRNLIDHFDVAYYNKIRISLMNLDESPGLYFSFRRYHQGYMYKRAVEILDNTESATNNLAEALTYARTTILKSNGAYGARQNVPKVVVTLLGSKCRNSIEEATTKLLSIPYLASIAVGYGKASKRDLALLSGKKDLIMSKDRHICGLWKKTHKVITKKLKGLYSIPLKKPSGFRLAMIHSGSLSIKWNRPIDLVNHYSIQYRPLKKGKDGQVVKINANIGQEHRTKLSQLDSTEYEFQVIAHGVDQQSEPSIVTFDMACATASFDGIVVVDTSNFSSDNFSTIKQGFLSSFVDGFIISWNAARIGVVLYADEPQYWAPLSSFTVKQQLLFRISQLNSYDVGNRNTGAALNFAYLYGFEYARHTVPKILTIVTSGKSNDDLRKVLKRLKADGTIMFHIQVGGAKISRRESHFYHQSYYVKTYKDLDMIQFSLSQSICEEVFNYYQRVNPSLPSPLSVKINDIRNTSIEVTWSAPESSLITGYIITCNGSDAVYLVGKSERSLTLYNLLPGHTYNVSVQSKGYGKDSDKTHVITTTDMFPPLNVSVEQNATGSLLIKWCSPSAAVIRYRISVLIRQTQQMIQANHSVNTTTYISSNIIRPGYEYEIRVQAVYVDDVYSTASRAYITTDLPIPGGFHVSGIAESRVELTWRLLKFPNHEADDNLLYLIKLFDEDGNQVKEKFYKNKTHNKFAANNKDLQNFFVVIISDLTPGRKYNATLQASMNGHLSYLQEIQFQALRINLALEIVVMFEMAPNLLDRDIVMTRQFLKNLVNCYETLEKNSVSLQVVQLSNTPTIVVNKQESQNRTFLLNQMMTLNRKAGTSVLSHKMFKETVFNLFQNSRSGVPRILLLILTNQHYSNLMPESESELAENGITSIIIQMAHNAEVPYSKYVLGGFDQFNLVLNHAVIDCARSDEFSLNRIKRERLLQPHQLTVYQSSNGRGVAEWWAPDEWPELYGIKLLDTSGLILSDLIKPKRQVQLRYSFTTDLKPNTNYTLMLEAFDGEGVKSKSIVYFRIFSNHRWSIDERTTSRDDNRNKKKATRPKIRPSKYLKAISTSLSIRNMFDNSFSCIYIPFLYFIIFSFNLMSPVVLTLLTNHSKTHEFSVTFTDHVVTEIVNIDMGKIPLEEMAIEDSYSHPISFTDIYKVIPHSMSTRLTRRRASTCLMAGCNIVFLIDSTNTTQNRELKLLKNWLKQLINSLQIEAIDKAAENKKRQAVRRHNLHKLPPIAIYGVGLSIVQFAEQAHFVLPMMTRLTRKQINQYVNTIQTSGRNAYTGRALDFVRRNVFRNNSTKPLPTRNIVVLITSDTSKDNAVFQARKLKREGILVFVVALKDVKRNWANALASKPSSTFSIGINHFSMLPGVLERMRRSICQASTRRKRVLPRRKKCLRCIKGSNNLPVNGFAARNVVPIRGFPGQKGQRGSKGAPGQRGFTGSKGEPGNLGPRGPPGPPGKPCLAGPEAIKEIIPRAAGVRNKRSLTKEISVPESYLNYKDYTSLNHQPDVGPTGPQGPPGVQGSKGEPGCNTIELESKSRRICKEMIDEYDKKLQKEIKLMKQVDSAIDILQGHLVDHGFEGSLEQQIRNLIHSLNDNKDKLAVNFKQQTGDKKVKAMCNCEHKPITVMEISRETSEDVRPDN